MRGKGRRVRKRERGEGGTVMEVVLSEDFNTCNACLSWNTWNTHTQMLTPTNTHTHTHAHK